MDRGIKDEAFVRKALEVATNENGRWIANQACFNGLADSPFDETAKAGMVTAVAVFKEQGKLKDEHLAAAHAIRTVGDARALIDVVSPLVHD
ncbi:hypothetical protein [Paraburkholderia sp. SIMBA_054]|uniref:hypothetical protein n=1 Tax=Paraburkholderia sp. SIMBA_054 TaxID=3085795 RepID=UPI00397C35A9